MSAPVIVVANGDLRLSANQKCWPTQERVENAVMQAVRRFDREVHRGHEFDPAKGHGFIDSQKRGIEVFRSLPKNAPLIVVDAVWQYSQHLLAGLMGHQGPILTIANWSGEWPGLVGLLNLNASLRKAGVRFDSLWSADFDDDFFLNGLKRWLSGEPLRHDASHAKPYAAARISAQTAALGAEMAADLRRERAILGIFDEGCMGMYNAIIPDEHFHAMGIFKERLSQSALYAEMRDTPDSEAWDVYDWLRARKMRFIYGPDPAVDLTQSQVLEQCKMYIAALRISDAFGCDVIGIQYQQGLKDLTVASDLAEGLLNNVERPPVRGRSGELLYEGAALPHFNEVDECAGLDALVTNRIWRRLGLAPETTLHDVRYGEFYGSGAQRRFVWTLQISGALPPAHLAGGYAEAVSERQPPMYFRLGGGTIKGVSKPGHIVWSRVSVEPTGLKADLGLCESIALPQAESDRRSSATTPQWPMVHAVFPGISRDQFMARHGANHIQVAYAPDMITAEQALAAKAAMFDALGLKVSICGNTALTA
jgi:L-fucose isomerase-like protein